MNIGPVSAPPERRAALIVGCVGTACAFLVLVAWALSGGRHGVVFLSGSSAVIVATSLAHYRLTARARRREFQTIRAMEYRICPRCNYDLRQLPPAGNCPECGLGFDPALLEQHWRSQYGIRAL